MNAYPASHRELLLALYTLGMLRSNYMEELNVYHCRWTPRLAKKSMAAEKNYGWQYVLLFERMIGGLAFGPRAIGGRASRVEELPAPKEPGQLQKNWQVTNCND